MKKLIASIIACFLPTLGWPGSAELTWTAPTQNTDGSTLTDLSGYRIYYGTSATNLNQVLTLTNAGLVSYVVPSLTAGTWYFEMTALAGPSPYRESTHTNQVSKEVLQANPNPPTDLRVSSTVAYTLVKQRDRMVMLPVGTVPANTDCIRDQTANGYFAVPYASVTFSGSVKPEIVFAQCS